MNPISAFFAENIVAIFFIYGLAFFAMGLALVLASRRASEFAFVRAIRPLAAFGLLHGLHEWLEMFQKMAEQTSSYTPTLSYEILHLMLLAISFLMLAAFGLLLLKPEETNRWPIYWLILGMAGLWGLSVLGVAWALRLPLEETLVIADVLARYSLGVPGALLGTGALMAQQRTFREHGMPQFGRDLVWCATALFLYGVIGQVFVRQTSLPPSTIINNELFLQWFGIPVQLFRGTMATILAIYMVRALNAFELESQRRLAEANEAKLKAQAMALETERRISQEMEHLNEELRLTTRELSLLLELSNLLVALMSLPDRLQNVLQRIVHNLNFAEAGMILLIQRETRTLYVSASLGFAQADKIPPEESPYLLAQHLGAQCVTKKVAMCRHLDGTVIEFILEVELEQQACRRYVSPVTMISLPLTARQQVIGSLVLGRTEVTAQQKRLSPDEYKLMLGLAQQLGLSVENARLHQEAQERESTLGELLHQVVGAQEAERQRMARELHDATGQSLTAIALGLRGLETTLAEHPSGVVEQIRELKLFSTNALGELRQIITDLRPAQLDDLGLVAALQWYAQEFEKRRAIGTEFVAEGVRSRLPAEYEIVLFRIVQEALSNVAKHARASHALVKLEFYPAQVRVTIEDDGCGFEPKEVLHQRRLHAGWGLLGIQERALLLGGQCEFDSRPGRGTRIRVKVPLLTEIKDVKDTAAFG
jgi:signal transduction histidine kinase